MTIAALDGKINIRLFLKGLSQRIQGVMARSLPDEQKLSLIVEELARDTQEKRSTARNIRARMVALADAETAELEPLEALRAKRAKLVALGARVLKEKEALPAAHTDAIATKAAQLGQIAQEIKALESPLRSMESTYATLKESYGLAFSTYKTALEAYERAKATGPTLLLAIKAHREALSIRDSSRKPSATVDASFLDQLGSELDRATGELHADQQIEDDLDATKPQVIGARFAAEDAASVDEAILEEFRKQ